MARRIQPKIFKYYIKKEISFITKNITYVRVIVGGSLGPDPSDLIL